jgi:hypothetical protein
MKINKPQHTPSGHTRLPPKDASASNSGPGISGIYGPVAQLGERLNGIQEVACSIHVGSTSLLTLNSRIY